MQWIRNLLFKTLFINIQYNFNKLKIRTYESKGEIFIG